MNELSNPYDQFKHWGEETFENCLAVTHSMFSNKFFKIVSYDTGVAVFGKTISVLQRSNRKTLLCIEITNNLDSNPYQIHKDIYDWVDSYPERSSVKFSALAETLTYTCMYNACVSFDEIYHDNAPVAVADPKLRYALSHHHDEYDHYDRDDNHHHCSRDVVFDLKTHHPFFKRYNSLGLRVVEPYADFTRMEQLKLWMMRL